MPSTRHYHSSGLPETSISPPIASSIQNRSSAHHSSTNSSSNYKSLNTSASAVDLLMPNTTRQHTSHSHASDSSEYNTNTTNSTTHSYASSPTTSGENATKSSMNGYSQLNSSELNSPITHSKGHSKSSYQYTQLQQPKMTTRYSSHASNPNNAQQQNHHNSINWSIN
jgi:hypothetical protein